MRNTERRLAKIEQQVNEVLGPPPLTEAEQAAKTAAWNAMVWRWSTALVRSMDVEKHQWVIDHWLDHLFKRCQEKPCGVVPPGLLDHLWKLWGWKWDESKPIALPAEVVEVYLTNDRLNTRPHLDCEDCGYPLPISFFFVQSKQVSHFERCPLCGGVTGWRAFAIRHKEPGFDSLKPYGDR